MKDGYQYENRPRNVFRFGLAVWRVLKGRGYRIEKGEIENAILEYPVKSVVVDVHLFDDGDRAIVAWFSGDTEVSISD